jgi:hypothetical protein
MLVLKQHNPNHFKHCISKNALIVTNSYKPMTIKNLQQCHAQNTLITILDEPNKNANVPVSFHWCVTSHIMLQELTRLEKYSPQKLK